MCEIERQEICISRCPIKGTFYFVIHAGYQLAQGKCRGICIFPTFKYLFNFRGKVRQTDGKLLKCISAADVLLTPEAVPENENPFRARQCIAYRGKSKPVDSFDTLTKGIFIAIDIFLSSSVAGQSRLGVNDLPQIGRKDVSQLHPYFGKLP